jgi:hypothetical protein
MGMKRLLALWLLLAAPAWAQNLDGLPQAGVGTTPPVTSSTIVPLCVGNTTSGVPGTCIVARTTASALTGNPTGPINLPVWTTATRPAPPIAGTFGFNTTVGSTEFWTGSAWQSGTSASFLGGVVPNASQFTASGTALSVTNNETIGGTLGVTGATTLAGALTLSAAGTALAITNNATIGGTLAVTGVMSSGGVLLPVSTVGALPSCVTGLKGAIRAVSDATSPTYNGTLTGGGAVSVPVYCNGSAWTAH